MKLNNANYMQFTIRNRSLKYLAGMFIPCDLLLKEDVKRTRNVFKTLSGISYIDWKSDPAHSFAENSYTDAPELKFSSNY